MSYKQTKKTKHTHTHTHLAEHVVSKKKFLAATLDHLSLIFQFSKWR